MRRLSALVVVVVVIAVGLVPSAAWAQDAKLEIKSGDTVKSVLERQVGKRVGVVLNSGPELTGVVASVGDTVVHLSGLTGRDYFDAVISLDKIGAVVIRARP